jgi:hypothetical protein
MPDSGACHNDRQDFHLQVQQLVSLRSLLEPTFKGLG